MTYYCRYCGRDVADCPHRCPDCRVNGKHLEEVRCPVCTASLRLRRDAEAHEARELRGPLAR